MPRRPVAVLAGLALLAGCGGHSERAATPAPPPALATVEVVATDAAGERLFDGVVEALEQATLVAQTSGRVVAVERDVDAAVDRGDVLLRLSGVEQRAGLEAARQGLVEAQARATEAATAHERVRSIYARRLVPRAELDRAVAEHEAAEARLAAARAAVAAAGEAVAYTQLRAPFSGRVTGRFVEVGEAVAPGQPLVAVAAPGRLRVVVDLPQALAADARRLGRATVQAGGERLESTSLTVFPAGAADSGTVRAWIDLPAGVEALYPGLRVKAGFALGPLGILRIPASALVTRSEVNAVYLVGADGRVTLRQIRLGRRLGGEVEVLAGLRAGDRLAADPVAATLALGGR